MDKSTRPTYKEASPETSLASAKSFIHRCRNITSSLPLEERLVEPVLTPRFVPTCSNEVLVGLASLSNGEDVKIQSHMHESRDQVDWVKAENGVDDIEVFRRVS